MLINRIKYFKIIIILEERLMAEAVKVPKAISGQKPQGASGKYF